MLRFAIAALVAPLVFPWISFPAIQSAFSMLSYGMFSWVWSIENAWLNAPFSLLHAYVLMGLVFIPTVLVFRRLNWMKWWQYAIAGTVLGYVCFSFVAMTPAFITNPPRLLEQIVGFLDQPIVYLKVVLWVPQLQHYQIGTTVAAGVMMICLWLIGVRANPWFTGQSNPPLNRTRADNARTG